MGMGLGRGNAASDTGPRGLITDETGCVAFTVVQPASGSVSDAIGPPVGGPLAALTLVPGVSSGFVGAQDRCSLPTPYPQRAGAGTANNSDFERSFTNGTAEDGRPSDSGYTGQVHFEGLTVPTGG